ncbi:MAG: Ger(x)C family spore germination C-terminal domain-containing protein [Clostridia bacterium]|nr:Ger(x)C family spore germination C-terminal domain-containing protein [Clostridia bacterium]
MKRKLNKSTLSVIGYWLIMILLLVMYFTNDFGLLDLRKTSVVIGVGLDVEEEQVVLTAQLAVPQPAENGENTKFNVVTGRGATVADALNEVNVKTGFYPKLLFCKLVLLGESCFKSDVRELLDYFYRNEYTGLTLNVVACEGQASKLIAQQFPCGNSATDVIDKLLSTEAQASGNVAAQNLKDVGEKLFSKSQAAYMPYLENGILEESQGGGSGGEGGGSGGSGGGGAGQQCEESELTCNKCAVFGGGYFKGVFSTDETFALTLLLSDVKHAFLKCGEEGDVRVLGLRGCKGGVDLKIEDDKPVLELKFTATAKEQDGEDGFSPERAKETRISKEVLKLGEDAVCKIFAALVDNSVKTDCDVLGLKTMLYKKNAGKYDKFAETLLQDLTVKCNVKLKSSG